MQLPPGRDGWTRRAPEPPLGFGVRFFALLTIGSDGADVFVPGGVFCGRSKGKLIDVNAAVVLKEKR